MRAVDTNVLVRLLVRDDPKQLAAAQAFVQPGAWVSHLVLTETVWVLDTVYEVAPAEFAAGVEMLLDHHDLTIQEADVVEAALGALSQAAGPGLLRLPDPRGRAKGRACPSRHVRSCPREAGRRSPAVTGIAMHIRDLESGT